jgi:hypothetical protein
LTQQPSKPTGAASPALAAAEARLRSRLPARLPSGIWAARFSQLNEFEEQLRDERRFTIVTTFSELAATPAVRMTIARAGLTYFIEAVRNDAELVCVELDVKQVF